MKREACSPPESPENEPREGSCRERTSTRERRVSGYNWRAARERLTRDDSVDVEEMKGIVSCEDLDG